MLGSTAKNSRQLFYNLHPLPPEALERLLVSICGVAKTDIDDGYSINNSSKVRAEFLD